MRLSSSELDSDGDGELVCDDLHISEDLNKGWMEGGGGLTFNQPQHLMIHTFQLFRRLPDHCHHQDTHIPRYVTVRPHIILLVNHRASLLPPNKWNQLQTLTK